MTPTLSDYYVPPTIRRIKKCIRCGKPAQTYSTDGHVQKNEGLCPECHEVWSEKKEALLREFISGGLV